MKNILWANLNLFYLGLVTTSTFSLVAFASGEMTLSLCQSGEVSVFSCPIAKSKQKILSICRSEKFNSTEGYLQYRFGTKDLVELEYPKIKEGSQTQFHYSRYTRPLVTNLKLKFTNEETDYEVFSNSSSEPGDKFKEAGIKIKPKNATPKTLNCTPPLTSPLTLMTLEKFLPKDNE